jgi:hypothetical protein
MKQRHDLEKRREQAKTDLDEKGHPRRAFFFNDAFTELKGDSPRFKSVTAKTKGMAKNTNRIFGVEVVCGDIVETFLYYADQFIAGGANILIEVQRQAMSDLANLLAKDGHPMPTILNFQFDNGSENKVILNILYLYFTVRANCNPKCLC